MTDNENESNNFLDAATVQRFDDLYVLLKDNYERNQILISKE